MASVKARSNGEKCPICSGARVIAGINDLTTLEPLLVKQWSKKNKIKPTEVSIGSHKKVIWRCEKGHEWEAAVKSRTINKTGCPYCSHNKVLAGFNDLATLLPDIAAEWSDRNYPLLPTQVTVFANRKVWWKCKDCGKEWNTLISTRSGGSKCPYCSGYIFLKGFNDLQTTHSEIASEWSEKNLPLKPDEVNAKSRKNVWWRCSKCGNEWKSVINARVKGTVCPVCAEREVLAGYNDLATTDNQLLSEWDYEQNKLKPTEVSRTSAKRAWWKCRHGHSWSMKINERTILNKGCRICEQEYLSLFPALAVSYYSNKKGLKAELGSDRLLGVPLETYIPCLKNSGRALWVTAMNFFTSVEMSSQAYEPIIQKYAKEYGIPEYVELIKAVMMQESGGRGLDPMQAAEGSFNTKYPHEPNGIKDPEYSIQCGVQELKAALTSAEVESPIDMEHIKLALQGYNFGNGYISWAKSNYGGYSYANAVEFSTMRASRLGWSSYGDTQYVAHVLRYYPYGRAFTAGGNQAIVEVALTQLGNQGGQPYWSWYGFNSRVEWCACFVSWCADQCGYIESGLVPKFAGCVDGANWFKSNGKWQSRTYEPKTGDIIFFDWEGDGTTDHVGIVEKCENGTVYTVEGNSGDACKQRQYTVGSSNIYGYGIPAY